jgi:hypothetical protein
MRRTMILAALICLLVPATASSAAKPEPYYAMPSTVEFGLQTVFDHASCVGVQRFGWMKVSSGRIYRVFDCTIVNGTRVCRGARVKTVARGGGKYQLFAVRTTWKELCPR